MESSERAKWVEYLLKRKFEGHGWSRWLLTHPPQLVSASAGVDEQRAKSGFEAEVAIYRLELEELLDDQLQRLGHDVRIRELEVDLQSALTKTSQLERENETLRAAEFSLVTEEPLATRERRTLLCIIGGLVRGNQLDLSKPYKVAEAIAAMMPDVRLTGHTIGNHLKEVQEAMDSRRC